MHDYMRAIGFSNDFSREGFKRLLSNVAYDADETFMSSENDKVVKLEYVKYFGTDIGLIIRGTMETAESGKDEIFIDYTVPFLRAKAISSTEKVVFEKHSATDEYVGICDDYRLGMPLIFHLQNMINYLSKKDEIDNSAIDVLHVSLAALSLKGAVMMPIEKNESEEAELKKRRTNRENLLRRARTGDENAIENMAIEDMDTFSLLRKKAQTEDVYSLVESYFMPSGIECDEYSVLGEIKDVSENINTVTGEEICILDVVADDIYFSFCIRKDDLMGEPEIGRRFKGNIWMQGHVAF